MRLITYVMVLIIITSNFGYSAQKKQKSTNKSKLVNKKDKQGSVNDAVIYSTQPIDLNTFQLPIKYMGHSINNIYNAINERTKSIKNEYETTEQFNLRIKNLWLEPLIGSMKIDNEFMLVMTPHSKSEKHKLMDWIYFYPSLIRSKYEADKKQLIINIENDFCYNLSGNARNREICYDSFQIIFKRRQYLANNSMGASVNVTESEVSKYGLMVNKDRYESTDLILDDIEPEQAKLLKDDIAVGIIYKLQPYCFEGSKFSKPTFSDPNDFTWGYYYAVGQVSSYWIFVPSTGKVLKKISTN